jgi:hypothetical protein
MDEIFNKVGVLRFVNIVKIMCGSIRTHMHMDILIRIGAWRVCNGGIRVRVRQLYAHVCQRNLASNAHVHRLRPEDDCHGRESRGDSKRRCGVRGEV